MEQIQLLLQNADMVKERERDVLAVSKSIVQLNSLFKDLAAMIVDQVGCDMNLLLFLPEYIVNVAVFYKRYKFSCF